MFRALRSRLFIPSPAKRAGRHWRTIQSRLAFRRRRAYSLPTRAAATPRRVRGMSRQRRYATASTIL